MEHVFFMRGLIIGFLIAAPVGPVGILCVNRTLSGGRMAGFVSGLGAVTGDGFYAAVAAYGVRFITSFLSANSVWFSLAGGIFLAAIGIKVALSKPVISGGQGKKSNLAEYYISAVMVTLTNPVTVVIFGAIFAALGLGSPGTGLLDATAIVAGIVAGAMICWFILSASVNALRTRFKDSVLLLFNRLAGAALMGFSLMVVLSAFRK
jgi:threonine/homoserine/homoserine lactone efflux protein